MVILSLFALLLSGFVDSKFKKIAFLLLFSIRYIYERNYQLQSNFTLYNTFLYNKLMISSFFLNENSLIIVYTWFFIFRTYWFFFHVLHRSINFFLLFFLYRTILLKFTLLSSVYLWVSLLLMVLNRRGRSNALFFSYHLTIVCVIVHVVDFAI